MHDSRNWPCGATRTVVKEQKRGDVLMSDDSQDVDRDSKTGQMRCCSCPFVSDASRTLGALRNLIPADRTPAVADAGADR